MHIRAYLEKKNKPELVALLLDLVQDMDEPTRQRFWEHLAPPGMATADLRYPSAEDFRVELEAFAEEVSEGEYYDEEAATYYGAPAARAGKTTFKNRSAGWLYARVRRRRSGARDCCHPLFASDKLFGRDGNIWELI